jgi:hypothetical protein
MDSNVFPEIFARNFRTLTALNLDYTQIRDDDLLMLTNSGVQLRSISLARCSLSKEPLV